MCVYFFFFNWYKRLFSLVKLGWFVLGNFFDVVSLL